MPKRAAEVDTSLVLVEIPRAVRVPDACPEPWAWFRPDSLQHSGGDVTGWLDVAGNDYHMVVGGGGTPLSYVPNQLDGNAAAVAPPVESFPQSLDTDDNIPAPHTFDDGITIFTVGRGDTAGTGSFYELQVAPAIIHDSTGVPYQSHTGPGGFLFGNDPAAAGAHALMGHTLPDGSEVGFRLNGGPWSSDGSLFYDPANEPWAMDVSFFQLFIVREAWVSELIIFDTVLTPECEAQWWSYLAGRYPSLGVG